MTINYNDAVAVLNGACTYLDNHPQSGDHLLNAIGIQLYMLTGERKSRIDTIVLSNGERVSTNLDKRFDKERAAKRFNGDAGHQREVEELVRCISAYRTELENLAKNKREGQGLLAVR